MNESGAERLRSSSSTDSSPKRRGKRSNRDGEHHSDPPNPASLECKTSQNISDQPTEQVGKRKKARNKDNKPNETPYLNASLEIFEKGEGIFPKELLNILAAALGEEGTMQAIKCTCQHRTCENCVKILEALENPKVREARIRSILQCKFSRSTMNTRSMDLEKLCIDCGDILKKGTAFERCTKCHDKKVLSKVVVTKALTPTEKKRRQKIAKNITGSPKPRNEQKSMPDEELLKNSRERCSCIARLWITNQQCKRCMARMELNIELDSDLTEYELHQRQFAKEYLELRKDPNLIRISNECLSPRKQGISCMKCHICIIGGGVLAGKRKARECFKPRQQVSQIDKQQVYQQEDEEHTLLEHEIEAKEEEQKLCDHGIELERVCVSCKIQQQNESENTMRHQAPSEAKEQKESKSERKGKRPKRNPRVMVLYFKKGVIMPEAAARIRAIIKEDTGFTPIDITELNHMGMRFYFKTAHQKQKAEQAVRSSKYFREITKNKRVYTKKTYEVLAFGCEESMADVLKGIEGVVSINCLPRGKCIISFSTRVQAALAVSNGLQITGRRGKFKWLTCKPYTYRPRISCKSCGSLDHKGCNVIKCLKCAQTGHLAADCLNERLTCVVCNGNHSRRKCSIYLEKLRKASKNKRKSYAQALMVKDHVVNQSKAIPQKRRTKERRSQIRSQESNQKKHVEDESVIEESMNVMNQSNEMDIDIELDSASRIEESSNSLNQRPLCDWELKKYQLLGYMDFPRALEKLKGFGSISDEQHAGILERIDGNTPRSLISLVCEYIILSDTTTPTDEVIVTVSNDVAKSLWLKSPEIRVGLKSPEIRVGLKPPEIRVGLKSPEIRDGLKSPEIRVGLKPPEIRDGLKSPEIRDELESSEFRDELESSEFRDEFESSETQSMSYEMCEGSSEAAGAQQ